MHHKKSGEESFSQKTHPGTGPGKWFLLVCVSVLVLVDTFFISDSPHLDPGVEGESMTFMVLGYRAVNWRGLSTPIMLLGTGLAIYTSCLNHRLLVFRPNSFSVLTELALWFILLFCGYTRKSIEPPQPASADAKSILKLSAKD
jgi:hypothetical protein